jgi:hypothetical protein
VEKAARKAREATNEVTSDIGKAAIASERIMIDGKPVHASEIEIPISYKQAEKTAYWLYWLTAIEDQIEDLNVKKTYTMIIKPMKAKVLPGQWRFELKKDANNYIIRFKARWVVCGNF